MNTAALPGLLAAMALTVLPADASACASEPVSESPARVTVTQPANGCPTLSLDMLDRAMVDRLLVDARSPLVSTDVRIPKALPAHAVVPTDQAAALVIGSGLDRAADQRACAALQASGFSDVAVLDGGVLAWLDAGLPYWGAAGARREAAAVAAAQAHAAAVRGDVLLAQLLDADGTDLCGITDGVVRCFTAVADLRAALVELDVARTVVLAAPMAVALTLREELAGRHRVLWLRDGAPALHAHLERFPAIARSSQQRLWMPCSRG
jgi:rhodanese-related sulfurtransferase